MVGICFKIEKLKLFGVRENVAVRGTLSFGCKKLTLGEMVLRFLQDRGTYLLLRTSRRRKEEPSNNIIEPVQFYTH